MSSALSYKEEVVDINKLKEDEELKTLVPPNNSAGDLEESLKENSQIFPLIVDRNYVLIDGYTRLSIMKKLGFTKVRVLKYNLDVKEDRVEVLKLVWVFNGARRQLDKNEKLAFYNKISEAILNALRSEKKEMVKLDEETVISASEYKRILEELDRETHYLSESDKEKFAILRINAPWLADYVIDANYKVPLNSAFRVYSKLKKTGDLKKLKDLPKEDRDLLIATNEGRKIILNDNYNYILQDILNGKIHTRDVLEKVKIETKKGMDKVERSQQQNTPPKIEEINKPHYELLETTLEKKEDRRTADVVEVILTKEKIEIELGECGASMPEVKKANISVYNDNEKVLKSGAIHIYKDRNGNICEISIEVFEG